MSFLYLFTGIVLYFCTVYDIVKTTFSSNGGGKITNVVGRGMWKLLFFAASKNGRSRILSYAGPVVVLSVLLTWILGLWLAFVLMLLSEADSVVNGTSGSNADVWEKIYYAGFTLSTLGIGDFNVTSDFWRVITTIAAFSGLAFITASITYFVPVLSAVVLQSKFSLYVSSMGENPQKALLNGWNGKDFSNLFDALPDVTQMLLHHTLHHHTYPVIHYFHQKNPRIAISPAIAQLFEIWWLLTFAVAPSVEKNQLQLHLLHSALTKFLKLVSNSFLQQKQVKENPPWPDVSVLRSSGIPLRSDSEIRDAITTDIAGCRELLSALLVQDGWNWKEVYGK